MARECVALPKKGKLGNRVHFEKWNALETRSPCYICFPPSPSSKWAKLSERSCKLFIFGIDHTDFLRLVRGRKITKAWLQRTQYWLHSRTLNRVYIWEGQHQRPKLDEAKSISFVTSAFHSLLSYVVHLQHMSCTVGCCLHAGKFAFGPIFLVKIFRG